MLDALSLVVMGILAPVVFALPSPILWLWRRWGGVSYLALLGLGLGAVATVFLFIMSDQEVSIPWIPGYASFSFILDPLSRGMGILTGALAFIIGIYAIEYMRNDYRTGWYWFFYNVFTSSMLLVIYSNDLLSLFIGWEGLGLASWALIGNWYRDDDELSFVGNAGRRIYGLEMLWSPSYSAYRAMVTVRIGDVPMLLSIAALWYYSGTLKLSSINWPSLANTLGDFGMAILLILLLLGPITKSAQFPFTDWLLTAMTGPTSVSALLHSATMVAAGAYFFMRLSLYVSGLGGAGITYVYLAMLILGLVTAIYGSLTALGTRERKVILAGSTASSLGIMFAATALSHWVGGSAIYVGFLYLVIHAVSKATLFLVSGHLIHVTHTRFSVGDSRLGRRLFLGFVATIIGTLSLGGIPPFPMYWVKSAMDSLALSTPGLGYLVIAALTVTSIIYSAFLARFLSLNFIKGGSVGDIETHGGTIMAASYTALAISLIPLTYVVSGFFEYGLEASSIMLGLLYLVSYVLVTLKPSARSLSSLGRLLEDRLYLPLVYDLIIPRVTWYLAWIVSIMNLGIDWLSHSAIPNAVSVLSMSVRNIQRGYLRLYLEITFLILVIAAIIVTMWVILNEL